MVRILFLSIFCALLFAPGYLYGQQIISFDVENDSFAITIKLDVQGQGLKRIASNAFEFSNIPLNINLTVQKIGGIVPEGYNVFMIFSDGKNKVTEDEIRQKSKTVIPINISEIASRKFEVAFVSESSQLRSQSKNIIRLGFEPSEGLLNSLGNQLDGGGAPPKKGPDHTMTREDSIWTSVLRKDSMDTYCRYTNDYPDSKYHREAKRICTSYQPFKIISIESKKNKNELTYTIQNATVEPSIIHDNGVQISERSFDAKKFLFSFKLIINDPANAKFQICDAEKNSRKPTECIALRPPNLQADWFYNPGKDSIRISIRGGVMPYKLIFKTNDIEPYFKDNIPNDTIISVKVLSEALKIKGVYTLKIGDATNFTFKEISDKPLYITIPASSNWVKFIYPYPIIFLFLSGLMLLLIKISRQRKRQELKDSFKNSSVHINHSTGITMEKESNPKPPIKFISLTNSKKENSNHEGLIAKGELSEIHFLERYQQHPYLTLSLADTWSDTALESISISKSAIFELDKFLREENIDKIPELEGNISEIGGMLVGSFMKRSVRESYLCAVEIFVPIRAKRQSVYELEFDAQNLALKLSDIQDEFPDYRVVGWFHTHPGHGLFLSKPDLSVHSHFKEPYQFAMIIDSLSENLDTGFFSWKASGGMNNYQDLKKINNWFSWIEIEKFTRRKK